MELQLVSSYKCATIAPQAAQGVDGEAVKQHMRTALSFVQSLVVDSELEARLKELQPLKLQTLHDMRASPAADGKSLGQMPLNGLKIRCARYSCIGAACTSSVTSALPEPNCSVIF